jgi:hypothetical protein
MPAILVHEFHLGDVEDPGVYAAGPILDWENTEKGQWCTEHALEQMYFQIIPDANYLGYKVQITADFSDISLTEYILKYK